MAHALCCLSDIIHTKLQSRVSCASASRSGDAGVLHSAQRLDMQNWNIYDLTQSVEANAGIIRRIRPRCLPSSSFSIHHSIITLQFEALNYKVLEPCTNGEQYRRVLSRSSPATLVTTQPLSDCLATRLLHH